LIVAVVMGHSAVAKQLIEAGALVDIADADGMTALHAAINHRGVRV
jgi:ankyrin repeat protein